MERPRAAEYGGQDILCAASFTAVSACTAGPSVDLEAEDRRGDAVGKHDGTAVGHAQPHIVLRRQGIGGGDCERGRCPHDEIRGVAERAVGTGDSIAL